MSKMVMVLYSHPENYPPTLNAIRELSGVFDQIDILHRPFQVSEWDYPENLNLHPSGKSITVRNQEQSPLHKKVGFFLQFSQDFYRLLKRTKPNWVLLYDGMPTFAYRLVAPFLRKKPKIWYHNHDVYQPELLKKYSLSWFAHKAETFVLNRAHIFSLPAEERKSSFDLTNFGGQYFMLPNFPSKQYIAKGRKSQQSDSEIRIIFQGSIGTGHGIEELIPLLSKPVNGKQLKLVLKGFLRPEYKERLTNLVSENEVEDHVEFIGITPYQEIAEITLGCHIGIAIFSKDDVMNRTLGTASNKIYEYAACGLPILYFDNEHFNHHLGEKDWAFATNISDASLISCIENIDKNYDALSQSAKVSFEHELNFENHFEPVINYLTKDKNK